MKARNPRHGSLQVWPRKRARREYPSISRWASVPDAKPLGFAGYKAGMTHIIYTDAKKTSVSRGKEVRVPVTVVECPPLKVLGVRIYGKAYMGYKVIGEYISETKEVARKVTIKPKQVAIPDSVEGATHIRLLCYTQPKLTTIGKKKPEIFEIAIGGSVEEQLSYAKEKFGKELPVSDVFNPGAIVDIHAVTKGYGFQGAVKRFGISLRSHKSEKGRRTPGSLGAWCGHGHMMPRVAHAGQTGYHKRTEYNKVIFALDSDVAKIAPKGGIPRYGEVRNTYLLVKGSIAGPRKRLVRLNTAIRGPSSTDVPTIDYISTESRQG